MNREEILEASRKEHKNRDYAELDAARRGAQLGAGVGCFVCVLMITIERTLTDRFPASPWIIYLSMIGTTYLVRFIRLRTKSDLFLAIMLLLIACFVLIVYVQQLLGDAP